MLQFPLRPYLNGTLTVNTVGIQTNANCSNPSEKPTLTPQAGSALLNLSSKSIDGCVHSLTFDPSVRSRLFPETYILTQLCLGLQSAIWRRRCLLCRRRVHPRSNSSTCHVLVLLFTASQDHFLHPQYQVFRSSGYIEPEQWFPHPMHENWSVKRYEHRVQWNTSRARL